MHRLVGMMAAGLLVSAVHAQQPDDWLTLVDGPDIVELEVSAMAGDANSRIMRMRVNLAVPRTLQSGEVLASYRSDIAIDCVTHSVWHLRQERFPLPDWQGASVAQAFGGQRPMAFYGIRPDPGPRVLRAACQAR